MKQSNAPNIFFCSMQYTRGGVNLCLKLSLLICSVAALCQAERKVQVLDFSEDNDGKNDTNGEFTSATLDIKEAPPTFTICSAFMVNEWSCAWGCYSMIFNLMWENGGPSLEMKTEANRTDTLLLYGINDSNWIVQKVLLFRLQWVHICVSIDRILGSLQSVVDGQTLNHDRPVGLLGENKTSNITLTVGRQNSSGLIGEHNVKIYDVNIFSSNLSVNKMEELTTPGVKACSEQGDILSWENSRSNWKLFSKAKFSEIDYEEGPCKNNTFGVAVLRGLSPQSKLDLMYMPMFKWYVSPYGAHLRVWLIGSVSSELRFRWVPPPGYWEVKHISSNITATSTTGYNSHALGRHTWTISGNTRKFGKNSYVADLKLTLCSEEEFTCRDGDCVKMDQRCDQIPNCKDSSDEIECQTVILDHGYRKDIPPIHPILNLRNPRDSVFPSLGKTSTTSTTSKMLEAFLPLDLEIEISNIKVVSMEMDEAQHYITFQFKISLTWRDQRVNFHNLKHDESLNALSSEEIEQIWLPLLIYDNTDDKDTTRLGLHWEEWSTLIEVQREGNFTRGGFDQIDEVEIFAGSENSLRMHQLYKRKFQCQYVLDYYPFDTQVANK